MASIFSKGFSVNEDKQNAPHLFEKLGRLLRFPNLSTDADDPVCLSALDDSTLSRFGFNETQIHLMKEGTFR